MAQPCPAIREGTATADIFIKHYAQAEDFGKLALWHEAAAECLMKISVPMNEIARNYYIQHGYKHWEARSKKEAREIQEQYKYHQKQAKIAWQRFVGGVCNPDAFTALNTERKKIAKFMAIWLPRYPNRFYEFGIYPTFFRQQREIAEQQGDYVKALQLEADAAEMCATQYEKIPIAYGLQGYQKHRDAYQRHAAQLRRLTHQNLKAVPIEADKGKQIVHSLETQRLSFSKLKAETVLHIAKSDARVKAALANQGVVHAYPSFQGFVWIVSFSNHTHGNLTIAIVDKTTMEVLDVLTSMK